MRNLIDSDSVLFLSIAMVASVGLWKACDGGIKSMEEVQAACLQKCSDDNVECIKTCLSREEE